MEEGDRMDRWVSERALDVAVDEEVDLDIPKGLLGMLYR